jgi:KDO2-lipid IV(A) lauroyltransferase
MNSIPKPDTKTRVAEDGRIPLYRFCHPRFWGIWLGIVLLRILAALPQRVRMFAGRLLGRLLQAIQPKRQQITRINLKLCFPELDDAQLEKLVRQHFESLGMNLIELGLSWWLSDADAAKLTELEGLEHLQAGLANGQGVIILSGHFASIEITGRTVKQHLNEVASMYRPTRNPFVDQILWRCRHQSATHLIPKDSMRQMIRLLKRGVPVWYAPDQAYDRKYSALVNFFDEPAMTNAALTNIARMTGAKVVPYLPYRLPDYSGYRAKFLPALENFPTNDEAADAQRINDLLEAHIRATPEQYYWIHRRFKNRPAPLGDPYANV